MRLLLALLAAACLAGCVTEKRFENVEADNRRLVEESIRRQGCLLERTAFNRALCFERVRTF